MNASPDGNYSELSRQVLVISAIVALVTLFLIFVWFARRVFFLIFGGILLAVMIRGIGDWIGRKTGMNRTLSITLVILLITLLIIGFSALFGVRIYTEAQKLTQEIPGSFQQVPDKLGQYPLIGRLMQEIPKLKDVAGPIWENFSSFFFSVTGAVMAVAFIAFLGVYLAYDPELYIHGLLRLFPARHRPHIGKALDLTGNILQWWLIGRLISMLVLGLLTGIGLWFLGINMALTLGVFAGIMAFVPYIGPIISFIPAGLVALSMGLTPLLWVLVLYMGIQIIESYVLTPLVIQRTILIPPLLTLTAQVILGMIAGVVGIVFAMPFTAVIILFVKYFYIQDVLGDEIEMK